MMAQFHLKQYLGKVADTTTLKQSNQKQFPQSEPIKHILIGSPKAVMSTIHNLAIIGYAQVGEWSPLLPTDNPGEVMSILNRRILTA